MIKKIIPIIILTFKLPFFFTGTLFLNVRQRHRRSIICFKNRYLLFEDFIFFRRETPIIRKRNLLNDHVHILQSVLVPYK